MSYSITSIFFSNFLTFPHSSKQFKPRTFKVVNNKCALNLICDSFICEALLNIYEVSLNPVFVIMILYLLSCLINAN